MKKVLKLFILIFITNCTFGQEFTDLYGEYLGQTPPDDTPIVFAPDLVSSRHLEHSGAIFSDDGSLLVWCSIRNRVKMFYQMQRVNNRWTKPKLLDFFKDSCLVKYDGPVFLPGTNNLFFNMLRERTDSLSIWADNVSQIWHSGFEDGIWTEPVLYNSLIYGNIRQVSFTRDSSIYYLGKQKGALNEFGIFYSKYSNGKYEQPQPMPLKIEESFQNWTPFISPDESYLIYSKCDEHGDYGDLNICFRNADKNSWSKPINMGNPINTLAQERFPTVSPDGKYLFFTRWTKENDQDIFWVKSDIIKKLKIEAVFE